MKRLTIWLGVMAAGALSCGDSDDESTDAAGPNDEGSGSSGSATSGATTTASTTANTTTTTMGTTTGSGASTGDGTETGVAPVGCFDYTQFTPMPVSYRADVMPIFAARCSGCHNDPTASVYYGMGGTTEAEAVAIYQNQLNDIPKQAPHLSFIVPGDPLRSYTMAKMEYDDPGGTCSLVQCSEPGCELQAPPAGQLAEPELAVMRSWIMNGAADD